MKIYNYLLLFLAFYFVTPAIMAQSNITLELRNAPVKEVFKKIKDQTGYKFFFEKDVINAEKKVTVSVKNAAINDVLKQLLKPFKVDYIIENKQILLKRKTEAAIKEEKAIIKSSKFRKITGYVLDSNGFPLPGASVWLKGTNNGVSTDFDGSFSLQAASGYTLRVSFIGFKESDNIINESSFYNITMEPEGALDEILIVSNGYQVANKERATGSSKNISSKNIAEAPSINILDRLEGKIAGVDFNPSKNTILIHGTNSYGKTTPLIVVDGFPMAYEGFNISKGKVTGGADLSSLNPESIESISFLKDAAAASIWGARAANGVIVVTTKQGKKGQEPKVTFSSALTMSDKPYLDERMVMNAAQYIDYEQDLFDLGYLYEQQFDPSWQNFDSSQIKSEAQQWMFKAQKGTATEAERDANLARLAGQDGQSQISKYLLRAAVSTQYNLAISGGSDKNTYYISGNYTNDKPEFLSNESESYNLTVNNNIKLFNDKVNLRTGFNYLSSTYQSNNTPQEALSFMSRSIRPYDLIADENGQGIDKYIRYKKDAVEEFTNTGEFKDWTYNYLDELNYNNVITKSNTLRLNVVLDTDITSWLNASVSGMYIRTNNEGDELIDGDSYVMREQYNQGSFYDKNTGVVTHGYPAGDLFKITQGYTTGFSLRGQLGVNKQFGTYHRINAIIASDIRDEKGFSSKRSIYGYNEDVNRGVIVDHNASSYFIEGWDGFTVPADSPSLSKQHDRYLSYVSNASYSYKNRYFLSGSLRYDDYNLLGADARDRAKPFWSSGLLWRLSDESFFNSSVINNLSLRATYGTGGNTPYTGAGNLRPRIGTLTNYEYGGGSMAYIDGPVNTNLRWELTKNFNFGLDYGIFNDRIRGSVDYYTKKTTDLIHDFDYNQTYGLNELSYNAGTLEGHGIDFAITANIIEAKFKWTTAFNLSYNTNEVTYAEFDVTNPGDIKGGSLIQGEPIGVVYAYKWAGLDSQGQSQIYTADGTILDANNFDYVLAKDDLVSQGTTTAPYFGGLTNTFTYGNITLSTQLNYRMGHVFRRPDLNSQYPTSLGSFYSDFAGNSLVINDRWRNPGDEATTNVPGLEFLANKSMDYYTYADVNVLSADHIRLQQIALTYQVPIALYSKIGFKDLSVSLFARDLGIIWRKNKEGYDPDYLATGSYNGIMPSRNYTLRVTASF